VSREKSAGMSQIIFGFEKKLQEREKTTYIGDVFASTASKGIIQYKIGEDS
jgi:hypothetical protein